MARGREDLEETYKTIGRDPQAWLALAQELKMSAEAIYPHLENALSLPPSFPGIQEKRFAYIHSYMLLNGLAFENVLKGIFIGRDPALATREKISRGILTRGGHGIADGARRILTLTDSQIGLLKRIEEYLVWAGRYPLPLTSDAYKNSEEQQSRSYHSKDRDSINRLFDRLAAVLQQEWQARP
jgi:hypothetical protein